MARTWEESDDDAEEYRWLISYADLITLLFAFFVVMYSTTKFKEYYLPRTSRSLAAAFQLTAGVVPSHKLSPYQAHEQWSQQITALLAHWVKEGQARVEQKLTGIQVELNATPMFASGTSDMQPAMVAMLVQLAHPVADGCGSVRIEGHTDDVPMRTPRYPTNWELSTARAARVARVLQQGGVNPAQITASGFGSYRPVADNHEMSGRQRNRRVTLWLEWPKVGCKRRSKL